ncbi:MAG: formylglycine-generating enzyme family protein [Armatimonadota bacterium]
MPATGSLQVSPTETRTYTLYIIGDTYETSIDQSVTVTVNLGSATNPVDQAPMVWVPGGTFTMGSPFDFGWSPPTTQQVTLSGYHIYAYEVTVAQYRAFCAATDRALPLFPLGFSWTGKTDWTDADLQQHPITNVSWDDASAYAAWAGMALPTEAQWEYAARGPEESNFPWGGTATAADPDNGWGPGLCAFRENSLNAGISTWPVGSFPPAASWCGAHDLAGNIQEWCADWWGAYSLTPVTNPTGPASGYNRVIRGGSWSTDDYDCRSIRRGMRNADTGLSDGGFRCVSK